MSGAPAGPAEAPIPPGRELDDLITRHLDAALDAAGQRRLAALLAASPEARRTLARYLRLEGGLIRLAAGGLVGGATGDGVGQEPAPGAAARRRGPRPAAFALAGSLLVIIAGAAFLGSRSLRDAGRPDLGLLAERWLELRGHADGGEPADGDDDSGDVAAEPMADPPPAWLVAAVAAEGAASTSPDPG